MNLWTCKLTAACARAYYWYLTSITFVTYVPLLKAHYHVSLVSSGECSVSFSYTNDVQVTFIAMHCHLEAGFVEELINVVNRQIVI